MADQPMVRVVVDAAGRLQSIAYTNLEIAADHRVLEVTQTELDRLLADDYVWVNNRQQLIDPEQIRVVLRRNRAFLAVAAPTAPEVVAQVQLLSRVVEQLMRVSLSAEWPFLLDDVLAP